MNQEDLDYIKEGLTKTIYESSIQDFRYTSIEKGKIVRQFEQSTLDNFWFMNSKDFKLSYKNSYFYLPLLHECLKAANKQKIISDYELTKNKNIVKAYKTFQTFAYMEENLVYPDGTFLLMGQSMAYRAAAFSNLAYQVLHRKIPNVMNSDRAISALTAVINKLFLEKSNENFDKNGFLTMGLIGNQKAASAQPMTSGSLYLTSQVLVPLGISFHSVEWNSCFEKWMSYKAWTGEEFNE